MNQKDFRKFYAELSGGVAWAMVFALASIIISIIAIAKCAPSSPITADYIGVIVGILSLLVTVLIGWQIFTLIKADTILKRVDEAEKNLSETETNIMIKVYKEYANTSALHILSLIRNVSQINETHVIDMRLAYGISAQTLHYQLLAKQNAYIDACLATMENGVRFAERLNVWEDLFDENTTLTMNNFFHQYYLF